LVNNCFFIQLVSENGQVKTDYTKRAKTDSSLKGIKKMAKGNLEKAVETADEIIRNTYRTLITRGQKGCFVYCTNKELEKYFLERLKEVHVSYEKNEFLNRLAM